MWRRFVAMAAVLVLLCGFSAAPYTHAHHAIDSVGDERHAHGDTLVHTHASPHAHRDAGHPAPLPADPDEDEQIWSVNSFVFQQTDPSPAPSPVLLAFVEPYAQLTSHCLRVDRPQPTAHGPPVGSPSGLRAPPAFQPAIA
jgi:hypothetical protein